MSRSSRRQTERPTTGLGKYFLFLLTVTEVRCSEDIPDRYHLYREFDLGLRPRLYILHGSLRHRCVLDPVVYRAFV